MSLHETNNLEKARLKREYSVSDLCELVAITPSHWSQLISGQRMPGFPLACSLSLLLREPIDSLFNVTNIALRYFSAQEADLFTQKKKG